MKNITIATLAIILLTSFLVTGFQCGSPEMTSAKLYLQRNDYANAEKALMREVEKNPANAEAWYLLGQTRAQMGNPRGMLEAVDKSLAASKEFEKDILQLKRFGWAQSLNRGVDYINRSMNASPDSGHVLLRKALDELGTAILIFPDSMVSYLNTAVAYQRLGEYDSQIDFLKKYLDKKPDPEARTNLINAYLQKAQDAKKAGGDPTAAYDLAIAELIEARKTDPDNQELLGTLINVYIEIGRASEAFPFIQEAVEKDPGNAVFQNNLGLLLMNTDKLEEAITHFSAALSVNPTFSDALRNGAVAHLKLGDKMKQEATAKTDLKTKQPTDRSYLEHFKKAVDLLEQLTKIPPYDKDPNVWDALASAYGNAGMIKQAEQAIKTSDSIRKGN